MIFGDIFV